MRERESYKEIKRLKEREGETESYKEIERERERGRKREGDSQRERESDRNYCCFPSIFVQAKSVRFFINIFTILIRCLADTR